ncbi:TetR/AcrR family transcriptional regulator [Pseudoalteromonas sp. T1lg22]|uniref:TetR/AcrR family transcriptional regulator n=1 Tax=Pseudoalteromonas sp. T1lg22 TaxID=2077096 RepID=UPI002D79F0FC|nr:helix-turn-helix domain-containing protein [Pseudoalteromonas sp. T1lg22]
MSNNQVGSKVISKKQLTRERILDAAWQLFQEHGFAATSTRDIAKQAQVANGTLFTHFENKDDLLRQLMLMHIDKVIASAKREDTFEQPKLKMRHYALHLYRFYLQHTEFSKSLLQGLVWQGAFFSAQMEAFKKLLFDGTRQYDEVRAAAMMDCYFMTLIEGLNSENPDVSTLVRRLSAKIALL